MVNRVVVTQPKNSVTVSTATSTGTTTEQDKTVIVQPDNHVSVTSSVGLQGPPGQDGQDGQNGQVGPQGPQGNPGIGGAEHIQGFAIPSQQWVVLHNFGTKSVVVETFDQNGDSIEGEVDYPDDNTITVSWYYPTAGSVRAFN